MKMINLCLIDNSTKSEIGYNNKSMFICDKDIIKGTLEKI